MKQTKQLLIQCDELFFHAWHPRETPSSGGFFRYEDVLLRIALTHVSKLVGFEATAYIPKCRRHHYSISHWSGGSWRHLHEESMITHNPRWCEIERLVGPWFKLLGTTTPPPGTCSPLLAEKFAHTLEAFHASDKEILSIRGVGPVTLKSLRKELQDWAWGVL